MNFVVVISTCNTGNLICRCLDSVSKSLNGHRWALVIADDGSTDRTAVYAENHTTTSELRFHARFQKAPNVSVAKNNALSLLGSVPSDFDWVLFMDDDDEMLPARAKLAECALTNGQSLAFGDMETVSGGCSAVMGGGKRTNDRRLSPCTSVIRRSLVHSKFWREASEMFEDSYTFSLLRRNGVVLCYHPVGPVHRYIKRPRSCSSRIPAAKAVTEAALRSSRVLQGLSVGEGPLKHISVHSAEIWGNPEGPTVIPPGSVVLSRLDEFRWNSHPGRLLLKWDPNIVVCGGLWLNGWPVEIAPFSPELVEAVTGYSETLSIDREHVLLANLLRKSSSSSNNE